MLLSVYQKGRRLCQKRSTTHSGSPLDLYPLPAPPSSLLRQGLMYPWLGLALRGSRDWPQARDPAVSSSQTLKTQARRCPPRALTQILIFFTICEDL